MKKIWKWLFVKQKVNCNTNDDINSFVALNDKKILVKFNVSKFKHKIYID